jgi:hypothetical protein
VSALRFSWALIEQRKRNKPPFRNRLGSLAAIGLVLARCAGFSALLGAVQCCALCSAGGGGGGGYNAALCATQRWAWSAARCICAASEAFRVVASEG